MLGKGTDLRRYCNYIIEKLPLSCILMQVLEASPTPLIAGIWACHCMTSVSGRKVYVMGFCFRSDIDYEQDQIKGAHTFLRRGIQEILCISVRKKRKYASKWACGVSNAQTWLKVSHNPLSFRRVVLFISKWGHYNLKTIGHIILERIYLDWRTHNKPNCRGVLGIAQHFLFFSMDDQNVELQ